MRILKRLLVLGFAFLSGVLALYAQGTDSTVRLKLLFTGDIMGHSPQIAAATLEKDKLFDYTPCFQYIAPLLQEADLAVGNLELTLPGKPPYTGYPTFRSPDELALALRLAGFDLLVTANNHSNDSGLNGLLKTIQTVQGYGFYQTGTFADTLNRQALYPLIVYKGPFKLAFLNYTYGTNGIPTPKPAVVNLIDEKTMQEDLRMARKMQVDFVVVIVHWGNEYQLAESPQQMALAKKLFEWGADLVVGAHPHVIQPVKEVAYKRPGQDSALGLVAFSLGNFISAQKQVHTDMGLVFETTLEKRIADPIAHIAEHAYTPVFRYIHRDSTGKSQYYVIPARALEEGAPPFPLPIPEATRLHVRQSVAALRKRLGQYTGKERAVLPSAVDATGSPGPQKQMP
jgi:poly-gamma-glutamate synthesis protein (capsule biosynthesis protein)